MNGDYILTNETVYDSQDLICYLFDIAYLQRHGSILTKKNFKIYNSITSEEYLEVISAFFYWGLINEADFCLEYFAKRLKIEDIINPYTSATLSNNYETCDNIIYLSLYLCLIMEGLIKIKSQNLLIQNMIEKIYNTLLQQNNEFLEVPNLEFLIGLSLDSDIILNQNTIIISSGISKILNKYSNSLPTIQARLKFVFNKSNQYLKPYLTLTPNLDYISKLASNYPFLQ